MLKRISKSIIILFSIALIAQLTSCDSKKVYEKKIDISEYNWSRFDTVSFEFEIADTMELFNMYLYLGNTDMYTYSNLYMFIKTEFPDGTLYRDTVECVLADERGKWYGKKFFGDSFNNKILYRRNVRFPMSGAYTIKCEQAMRNEKLQNITNVGMRIEKAR